MSWGSLESARQAFSAAAVLDRGCSEAWEALKHLPPRPRQPVEFGVGDLIHGAAQRYRVTDVRIGGFSIVYLVDMEDSGAHGTAALKTFRGHATWSEDDRRRVQREALAWIALPPNPGVVAAYLFDMIDGMPYLILEQVKGNNLGAVLSSTKLSVHRCLDYGIQICDAMTFLASQGIMIHGDLTPANCLLPSEDHIRLTDFGAAAAVRDADMAASGFELLRPATARRYAPLQGTMHYMAPEWAELGRQDVRSDLYSFGILLFTMLGGRPEGAARAVRSERTGLPMELAASEELVRFIHRCTDPSPRRRPTSFRAARAELATIYYRLLGCAPPAPRSFPQVSWNGQTLVESGRIGNPTRVPNDSNNALRDSKANSHRHRGISFHALGRLDKALRELDVAVQLDPRDAPSWATKSVVHWQLHQHSDAVNAMERAVHLIEDSPRASLVVASALIRMGDSSRAATVLEPAFRSPASTASACVLMSCAAIVDGQWSDCVTWADRARQSGDNSYSLLAQKALGLHFSGRINEALAISIDVAEHRPLIRLGWAVQCLAHLAHDDLTAAEYSFARVRDLSPALGATAWALRGRLAESCGRYDEAGRSVVEARNAALHAEPVDSRIASAVLSDGEWADRAIERSRQIGDLIARALRHLRGRPPEYRYALQLVADAFRIDTTSTHAADGAWILARELGGARETAHVAELYFSGQDLEHMRRTILSHITSAQSLKAT
jgi:serine/threonine protein kinase